MTARALANTAAAAVLVCLAPAPGCGYDEAADAPSKAPRGRVAYGTEGTPNSAAPAAQAPAPSAAPAFQAKPAEAAAAPDEGQAAAQEEPPRDLGAELRAAFGSPVSCIKPRPAEGAPPAINIEVEAHLVETGLVTRGYVRSSQLDEQELACLERRFTSLRLKAPIENAPRTARTSIKLELKPPEKSGP